MKSQFQLVRVVHWAVQTRFHSNIFPQLPVYLLSASPLSPYFLALSSLFLLLFILLLSCTRQTYLQTVPMGENGKRASWNKMGQRSRENMEGFRGRPRGRSPPKSFHIFSTTLSWSPPKSFHIFSTTLSHHIPARPFVMFSHTVLSTMAGNLFSGIFFTLYRHFNFLMSLICFKWAHS